MKLGNQINHAHFIDDNESHDRLTKQNVDEFTIGEKGLFKRNIGFELSKDGMSTNQNTATIAGTMTNPIDIRT
jgi:hypothetical protein